MAKKIAKNAAVKCADIYWEQSLKQLTIAAFNGAIGVGANTIHLRRDR